MNDERITNQTDVKGEGDHEAGREYQERTEHFVRHAAVQQYGERAKRDLEDDERGEELEKARRETKEIADYDDV